MGGDTLSFVVSRGPQTQTLFTDIIISFNLSIHIQKTRETKRAGNTCMKYNMLERHCLQEANLFQTHSLSNYCDIRM